MSVTFNDFETSSNLTNKRKLKEFVSSFVEKKDRTIDSLDYIFCTDEYLLSLNEKFLNHDTLTDILTFDLSDEANKIVAEVYISTERVLDNAIDFGVSYDQELHRVIFHGMLHLLGFQDKTDIQKEEMREAENECLNLYFESI